MLCAIVLLYPIYKLSSQTSLSPKIIAITYLRASMEWLNLSIGRLVLFPFLSLIQIYFFSSFKIPLLFAVISISYCFIFCIPYRILHGPFSTGRASIQYSISSSILLGSELSQYTGYQDTTPLSTKSSASCRLFSPGSYIISSATIFQFHL